MGAPILDEADRPRAHIKMRFLSGRSDSQGVMLKQGDYLPVLELQLLDGSDNDTPMVIDGLDVSLRWRLNRGTAATKELTIEDVTTAIVLYPLEYLDLPSAGSLHLEAVISDGGEELRSAAAIIAVEASI